MNGKVARYLPLILFEFFLGATYFVYRCGPWLWPYRKDNLTLLFVFACLLFFAMGYIVQNHHNKKQVKHNLPVSRIITAIIIVIDFCLMIPYCLVRTGSWFPHIVQALKDLSVAYGAATIASGNYGMLHVVVGFGAIFIYLIYCITYFYWEELDTRTRIICLLESIWFYLVDLCTGRNKGALVVCILIIIMFIIKLCDARCNKKNSVFWWRTIITIAIIATVPLYFWKSMNDRGNSTKAEIEASGATVSEIILTGAQDMIVNEYNYKEVEIVDNDDKSQGFDEYNVSITPGKVSKKIVDRYEQNAGAIESIHPYYADEFTYAYVNIEDPLYKILPERLQYFYVLGTSYVAHGYHGVALALRLPFDSCYGLGSLVFLQDRFKNITGIDVYKRSYIYKVNQAGYPISLKWGTAFVQWASDISFAGVVFLMGVFGWLMAKLWDEVLTEHNIISLILLLSLVVNLLFITSWWQAGMSGTDFIWFYGSLAAWIIQKFFGYWTQRKNKD